MTFDLYYTDDALGNPIGGRSDFALWGRIRDTINVDFSRFTNWQGLTFHATGLWQYGTDLSKQYTFTAVDSSSLPSAHICAWIPTFSPMDATPQTGCARRSDRCV